MLLNVTFESQHKYWTCWQTNRKTLFVHCCRLASPELTPCKGCWRAHELARQSTRDSYSRCIRHLQFTSLITHRNYQVLCVLKTTAYDNFRPPASGVAYNFEGVCLSVWICLYICNTITFESFDVGSSYLHMRYISRKHGSSSYTKVIGSRSRSQEQKLSEIPIPAVLNFDRQ